jgi:hypothetical protein
MTYAIVTFIITATRIHRLLVISLPKPPFAPE